MSTVLMINAEWNLKKATLSVEVSNCQTHVSIFGVLIKKLHCFVKQRKDHLWMEQPVAETRFLHITYFQEKYVNVSVVCKWKVWEHQ